MRPLAPAAPAAPRPGAAVPGGGGTASEEEVEGAPERINGTTPVVAPAAGSDGSSALFLGDENAPCMVQRRIMGPFEVTGSSHAHREDQTSMQTRLCHRTAASTRQEPK